MCTENGMYDNEICRSLQKGVTKKKEKEREKDWKQMCDKHEVAINGIKKE